MELLLSAGGKSVLNDFDCSYRTPLMWAAERDIEIVRMLIDVGADVNAFDEIQPGTNALLEAVKRGGSYEMVELLVNAGADPTITGMGITSLDEARWRVKFSTPAKEEEDLKILALLEEATKKFTVR